MHSAIHVTSLALVLFVFDRSLLDRAWCSCLTAAPAILWKHHLLFVMPLSWLPCLPQPLFVICICPCAYLLLDPVLVRFKGKLSTSGGSLVLADWPPSNQIGCPASSCTIKYGRMALAQADDKGFLWSSCWLRQHQLWQNIHCTGHLPMMALMHLIACVLTMM